MASPKDKVLRFFRRRRLAKLAIAWRARRRRQAALKRGNRKGAQSALRVLRRARAGAQDFLSRSRRRRKKLARKAPPAPASVEGLVWMDSKQVAGWIAADLRKARASGLWRGYVVSGWRSRPYSRSLCIAMCGAPFCRGRCAGERSNHVGINYPEGAVDVTDYYNLKYAAQRLGLRIRNSMPRSDPVHFSASGY